MTFLYRLSQCAVPEIRQTELGWGARGNQICHPLVLNYVCPEHFGARHFVASPDTCLAACVSVYASFLLSPWKSLEGKWGGQFSEGVASGWQPSHLVFFFFFFP